MVRLAAATTLAALVGVAAAQAPAGGATSGNGGDSTVTCGANKKCPTNLPCCSQYGQCGVGAYCLGGCDPQFSNSLDSCVPAPVCKDKNIKFNSLDPVIDKSKYLGDASKADFVADGNPNMLGKDAVLLTLQEDTTGTILASTSYVWYGKISARMKTSHGKGVVTAFILLSDVKDEIDFEFVGVDLNTAQTNYYFQGITNYNQEKNVSVRSNTFNDYHTYEIDWQPDQITWSIDGQVGRTQKKSDTWNATSNQYHFPQSPARVQLSLWPAGLPSNGKGTVDWSGGQIEWQGPNYQPPGYYYASVSEVDIQCYDPPPGIKKTGSKSYVYGSEAGTNDTLQITDKNTVLKSLLGTGTNMTADFPKKKPSGTASADSSATSINDVSIPGQKGAGPAGGDSGRGNGGSGDNAGASGTAGAAGSTPGDTSSGPAVTNFVQGPSADNNNKKSAASQNVVFLQGSLAAAVIALGGVALL